MLHLNLFILNNQPFINGGAAISSNIRTDGLWSCLSSLALPFEHPRYWLSSMQGLYFPLSLSLILCRVIARRRIRWSRCWCLLGELGTPGR